VLPIWSYFRWDVVKPFFSRFTMLLNILVYDQCWVFSPHWCQILKVPIVYSYHLISWFLNHKIKCSVLNYMLFYERICCSISLVCHLKLELLKRYCFSWACLHHAVGVWKKYCVVPHLRHNLTALTCMILYNYINKKQKSKVQVFVNSER
jgi:hypothetical protein